MAKYNLEDIEILRQKSGISYEEAVALLEYHNGSLARALVDLEKNGRIKKNETQTAKGLKGVLDFLYRMRLVVTKNNATIVNLSVLFMAVALIMAPYLCVLALILSLVLGYHITVRRNSTEFAGDSLENMVHNAKANVQESVRSFTRQFSGGNQTESPRSDSAPTNTRPVNVEVPREGSVGVHDDGDGYNEADIQ